MSDCCQTTEDGNAMCVLPADGQKSACACASAPTSEKSETSILLETAPTIAGKHPSRLSISPNPWQKIRSGVMFAVACIASPCCTPLIVPLGIALLAGTPVAAWLTAYLGWVYGGLTLLSVVSLVLGFRWMNTSSRKPKLAQNVRLSKSLKEV